jgi:hypothetical protein
MLLFSHFLNSLIVRLLAKSASSFYSRRRISFFLFNQKRDPSASGWHEKVSLQKFWNILFCYLIYLQFDYILLFWEIGKIFKIEYAFFRYYSLRKNKAWYQAAKIKDLLYHFVFLTNYRRCFKCYHFVAKQKFCREIILLNLGIEFLTLKVYIIVKLKKLGGFIKKWRKALFY